MPKWSVNLASICGFVVSRLRPAAVASMLIAVCVLALPGRAQTPASYSVTTLADTTDPTSSCIGGALGGADACSLRDAITLANANSGSTITLPSGLAGTIYAYQGLPYITANTTIVGPGANLLTIDALGSNLFYVDHGTLNISGVTITNGYQAIWLQGNSAATIDRCVITEMSDRALFISGTSTLTVTNSLIYGNSTENENGAGISNYGTLAVISSTITGNTSTVGGGGIYNGGTATILSSTIIGNTAANAGGGISNDQASQIITITNSIVSGNSSFGIANSDDCDNCGTQSNNLIGGTPPSLGPLAWNGGPTKTMIPLYGSAVIGAGIRPVFNNQAVSYDQRGFQIDGPSFDLGAVQTNYITVNTLADSDDGTCTATSCSLRDALNKTIGSSGTDIRFSITGSIKLTSGTPLPSIQNLVSIAGPGASQLTIDGTGSSSVGSLFTNLGPNLAISGVTITNGNATGTTGGAITNYSSLTVSNSVISGKYFSRRSRHRGG